MCKETGTHLIERVKGKDSEGERERERERKSEKEKERCRFYTINGQQPT